MGMLRGEGQLRTAESPDSGCCPFFFAPPCVYIGFFQPSQATCMASSSGLPLPPPCLHW